VPGCWLHPATSVCPGSQPAGRPRPDVRVIGASPGGPRPHRGLRAPLKLSSTRKTSALTCCLYDLTARGKGSTTWTTEHTTYQVCLCSEHPLSERLWILQELIPPVLPDMHGYSLRLSVLLHTTTARHPNLFSLRLQPPSPGNRSCTYDALRCNDYHDLSHPGWMAF
jgi:hypothetical protein